MDWIHPDRQTSFTYIGQETTYITKLFKHTSLKIAHRTNNSTELNLKPKAQTTNKHLISGVYKLTCADCGRAYVDQTEISLKGTKQYHSTFRNNSNSSKFSQHLNENIHTFEPMEVPMPVSHFQKKGPHLNTMEILYA